MSTDSSELDTAAKLPEKPAAALAEEQTICAQLIEKGVEPAVAAAVVGLSAADIPFIYAGQPHSVLHHRVRADWTQGADMLEGQSNLWIGTTDAIHNLVHPHGQTDQISEVVAQWRGEQVDADGPGWRVERLEVRQLGDGRFVEATYFDVSAMGALDGRLASLGLYVPSGVFRPYGTGRPRQEYRIYYFRRSPDGDWALEPRSNTSGTTILNGYAEMLSFHLGQISPVKQETERAYRFTPLEPAEPTLAIKATSDSPSSSEVVADLTAPALEVVTLIAPQAIEHLAAGQDEHEVIQMLVDAVLNHPEKIDILGVRLSDFSNLQRFDILQHIAKIIKDGYLVTWAEMLRTDAGQPHVAAIIERCAHDMLAWFGRSTGSRHDPRSWLAEARRAAELSATVDVSSATTFINIPGSPGRAAGANPNYSQQYNQILDGLRVSCVQQMLVYVAELRLRAEIAQIEANRKQLG